MIILTEDCRGYSSLSRIYQYRGVPPERINEAILKGAPGLDIVYINFVFAVSYIGNEAFAGTKVSD